MQIDGHHALTYVVARIAGMEKQQAEKLAYSAQYVDEATNSNPVRFKNGAMYDRIASAHKMLDYRNSSQLANHLSWIPFHFLPGNQGLPAGESPQGHFTKRLVCFPDSPISRDMLRMVMKYREQPFGLHMFGIAMHVYADTFAHQGFAGITHEINEVEEIEPVGHPHIQDKGLWARVKDEFLNFSLSSVAPLGHGPALSFPDRPYCHWSYLDSEDNLVVRDNPQIFSDAANQMYKAIRCYLAGDNTMVLENYDNIPGVQMNVIRQAFETIIHEEGEDRHKDWLHWIAMNKFGFGEEKIQFIAKGKGSWKQAARGKAIPIFGSEDLVAYKYREEFLHSDWKYFHDALKTFRLEIVRDILPEYGICVA
ncbi:DUF6765 family protein [Vibrio mangrovi]|uniref:DUF6765 family protein n=1 Tax=Vibrio mangrovi TaxID=474394 RepID=A0A1Y6IWS9_9VIBR|nr:DUF6765 family protein [Vibrio mangrovi]MDW6005425.1 DUF6765 family protein [Vibrio mangrovi]SMS02135.1 hypothetical protein VIM7927_03453 [Vibrio mangrovi]